MSFLSRLPASLEEHPSRALLALCLAQIVAWTLAPTLAHDMPPLDVVEGYMWGREWPLATFKHPAMPSWILEASRRLTGSVGWPAYLAAQLLIAATFLLVFALGRQLLDARRAAAGTLLLTGVFYFSVPTPELNHNVAQMPFWAAIALALWLATERGNRISWLLLGLVAAGGMYAKLSTGLLLFTGGIWMLADARARGRLATPGPWLGLAIFAALVLPLVLHLVRSDGEMLQYAAGRGRQFGQNVLAFLGVQALALAGAAVMLVIAGLGFSRVPQDVAVSPLDGGPVDPRVVRFLALLTLGPIALSVLLALLGRVGAKGMWGAPMLNLAGLLAVALVADRLPRSALRRLAVCAAALLVLLPAGYVAFMLVWAPATGRLKKQHWPQAEISTRLQARWASATGKPLLIVAGEPWVAGAVGLGPGASPSILTNGSLAQAPWISPERLKRDGALVVWQEDARRFKPPAIDALVAGRPVGEERFVPRWLPSAPPIVIKYVIIPPA